MDRPLRFFDVTMLVISLVIGMGIFRAPATVAQRSGSVEVFALAWIIGCLVAICGALAFAEAGRRMPTTGAYYRIFATAYHPSVAFAVNVIILVSNAASSAGVAIIGSEYISHWLPTYPPNAIAAAMIVALFGLNLLGLRTSATVQNALMTIKLVALAVIVSALVLAPGAHGNSTIINHQAGFWESLGMAMIPVAFTFGGYQSTINFGGESVQGTRGLPRAIIVGVLIIGVVYLLTNAAYIHVLGFSTLSQSTNIAAITADRLFGSAGANIVSIIIVVSVFGYVNVSMLANPRVILAMSMDGVLPRSLSVSAGGVQWLSLLLFTLLSILCVFVGETFEKILNYTIFVDAIGLALGALAIYRLRGAQLPRMVHLAVAVFVCSCLYTGLNIALFDVQAAVLGTVLFGGVLAIGAVAVTFRR